MSHTSRREFIGDVGRGMLLAGLGSAVATDLGFSPAFAEEGTDQLSFGSYDRLVDLLQSTPVNRLQPLLVKELKSGGASLKDLIAAAALANAETFGGQDYVGFHTAMAMLPAHQMLPLLDERRQPLPVLKVLYRNTDQIQRLGGASKQTLHPRHDTPPVTAKHDGHALRKATRAADMDRSEAIFASLMQSSTERAYNALQFSVQDDINVHRFVLAHRAYGLVGLLGQDYAHTILRQCVRLCVDHEQDRIERQREPSPIRALMPKLFDQYGLEGLKLGSEDPGDAWMDKTSRSIYESAPERSAEIVAAALAEGVAPKVVGEAISLASNLLVLRQGAEKWRVHGDSAGVHASDATNAWRNMARVVDRRNTIAGLIVAAYHSARMEDFTTDPYPTEEHLAALKQSNAQDLLAEAEDAVRQNDQGRAAAAIYVYGEQGHSPQDVFDRMLKYTISEDGRLHGEKYFQTVSEEFRTTRPAFRWRHLVGLARVTASAYGYNREDQHGYRAAGYEEACRLLNVKA